MTIRRRLRLVEPTPLLLHPGDYADLAAWAAASERVQEAFATYATQARETYYAVKAITDQIPVAPDPDEPPTDPRERALWLRHHRNTGPSTTPHQHRGAR